MAKEDDELPIEATEDQLGELRSLGVGEQDLEGLSYEDAQEWLDELRAQRRDAGKIGRE